VYVFVRPSGGWSSTTEMAKLTASDGAEGDLLCSSGRDLRRRLDDRRRRPERESGRQLRPGRDLRVREARRGWTSATETAKLTASGGSADNDLGSSVAVSGDGSTVVAGAPQAKVAVIGDGAAYVFVEPEGGWKAKCRSRRS